MKRLLFYIIFSSVIIACNQQQAYKAQVASTKDSLVRQVQQKDSSIMDDVKSINSIQKSIDTLMTDAKMLKLHNGEGIADKNTIASELRAIGALMIKNRKSIATLQLKLKKSAESNQDLVDLGENLSLQLNEKDSEIATIQKELVKTKASLGSLVKQFNDSMNVINQQRAQIGIMKIEGNTVYYVIGTESQLKKNNIITENGGALGLGRVPTLGEGTTGFMKGDLTTLHEIAMNGKFIKFVTFHPNDSYRIMSGATDKLIITDPQDFWSKSKYMVIIIK